MIATATNTVVATVAVGFSPEGVAFTPDGGFAYVANEFSDNVSVIATATNMVVATVAVDENPQGVAITPDGAFVYVTNKTSNTVSVIATATNTVVATVAVGGGPEGVAITPPAVRGMGAVVQSVTGSGAFTGGGGLLRTFSFTARRHADGSVHGRFTGFNRNSGGRIAGRVTCFTIKGNAAWIAGVIEHANFDVIGDETGWRAVDNGPASSATPDQLSFAVGVTAADFCAETPGPPPAGLGLVDIEAGDIKVQP